MSKKILLIQIPGYGLHTSSGIYCLQGDNVDILDMNLDVVNMICGKGHALSLDAPMIRQHIDYMIEYRAFIGKLNNDADSFFEFASTYTDIFDNYDLFGVSLNGEWYVEMAKHMGNFLKTYMPSATVVIGGAMIQDHYPEIAGEFMENGYDIVVCGDGRQQISEIVRSGNPQNCFSSTFRKDQTCYMTLNRATPLSMPKFHPNLLKYPYPQAVTIPLNMGCFYGRCTFCVDKSYTGGRYLKFDDDIIVTAAMSMKASGIPWVFLGGSGIRKKELKNLLIKLNDCEDRIPYFALECRPYEVDDELAVLLKDSRCIKISFGLESPDDYICNTVYNKGVHLKSFFKGLERLSKIDFIKISVNILVSSVFHRKKDLDDIVNFLNAHDCISDYVLYMLMIAEGTALEDICARKIGKPLVKEMGWQDIFIPEGERDWFMETLAYLADNVEKPFGLFTDEGTNYQLSALIENGDIKNFMKMYHHIQKDYMEEHIRMYFGPEYDAIYNDALPPKHNPA